MSSRCFSWNACVPLRTLSQPIQRASESRGCLIDQWAPKDWSFSPPLLGCPGEPGLVVSISLKEKKREIQHPDHLGLPSVVKTIK